jgi:hypothetical protein
MKFTNKKPQEIKKTIQNQIPLWEMFTSTKNYNVQANEWS